MSCVSCHPSAPNTLISTPLSLTCTTHFSFTWMSQAIVVSSLITVVSCPTSSSCSKYSVNTLILLLLSLGGCLYCSATARIVKVCTLGYLGCLGNLYAGMLMLLVKSKFSSSCTLVFRFSILFFLYTFLCSFLYAS